MRLGRAGIGFRCKWVLGSRVGCDKDDKLKNALTNSTSSSSGNRAEKSTRLVSTSASIVLCNGTNNELIDVYVGIDLLVATFKVVLVDDKWREIDWRRWMMNVGILQNYYHYKTIAVAIL